MRENSIGIVLSLVLLLAACAAPTAIPPVVTQNSTGMPPVNQKTEAYPNPPASGLEAIPYPAAGTPISSTSAYPGPGTLSSSTSDIPISGYEPQTGDASLKRDNVTLDLPNSQLEITLTQPIQVKAILQGSMADSCQSLRVVVTPADNNNVINLDAYTVVDTRVTCSTVIQPISAPIPLGSYSSGQYTVMVNGEMLGQFDTVYTPQPSDDTLKRAEINLDSSQSKLVFLGPLSTEEAAYLVGNLPDPCHHLRIVLTPVDSQNKISLEVYSMFDPQAVCVTVIQPFKVIVPLGNNPAGHYSVDVNAKLLGEFDK